MGDSFSSGFWLGVLQAGPVLLQFLVAMCCLIFALTRLKRYPRPTLWLVSGLGLLVCGRIASIVWRFWLVRVSTSGEFMNDQWMPATFTGVTNAAGLIMIVYAVFVARSTVDLKTHSDSNGIERQNLNSQPEFKSILGSSNGLNGRCFLQDIAHSAGEGGKKPQADI